MAAIGEHIVSPCPYCRTYGLTTHSFEEVAKTPMFGRIIYTCVSKATDYSNSTAIISHITSILDSGDIRPWTYVFDCNNLQLKHTMQFDLALTIGRLIREKYAEPLQMIFIINPTLGVDTLISRIVPIISPDSHKYIRKIKGSVLELYAAFKKEGIEEEGIHAIMSKIRG